MTAKEKANELYDKFDNLHCTTCDEYPELEVCRLCHHQIKQCALICVKEIIEAINDTNYNVFSEAEYNMFECTSDDNYVWEEKNKYWQEVKQEIEKL